MLRNNSFFKKMIKYSRIEKKLQSLYFYYFLFIFNKKIKQKFLIPRTFFSQIINKGDLVFDIGAHQGILTRIFLSLGANVVCVEPQDKEFNNLRIKFNPKIKKKKVILLNKALGKSEGRGYIMICDEVSTLSTLSSEWIKKSRFSNNYHWSKKQPIEITTLDALIKTYGVPKFCKIDVEGYELEVLEGLTQKIPFLSFEYTKELFKNSKKVCSLLESIGTVKFNCTSAGQYIFSNWIKKEILFNRIESHKNQLLTGDIYAKFK